MQLAELVEDIASALAAVDALGASHKQFRPGIGPFGEAEAVRAALRWLKSSKPNSYRSAATKRLPDLLIPGQWADSQLDERKAVVIFGYEHTPEQIPVSTALRGFELLARALLGLNILGPEEALRTGLNYPVHQQLRVYGYEVLPAPTSIRDSKP